jgi:hypothetical protein
VCLLQGALENYVTCSVCGGARKRLEEFRSLPLQVQGYKSLTDSLDGCGRARGARAGCLCADTRGRCHAPAPRPGCIRLLPPQRVFVRKGWSAQLCVARCWQPVPEYMWVHARFVAAPLFRPGLCRRFVRPEIMEGSNAVYCEACDKKTETRRGVRIKDAPKFLTVQVGSLLPFSTDRL